MEYAGAYLQYWRTNLLTMIEYRANFFLWFFFTIVYHGTALVALWVTLYRFPSLAGWNFRETALLYALWMLGHAVNNTFFFGAGNISDFIREGRFDRLLVRPLDPLFQAITVPEQIWPDEILLAIIYTAVVVPFAGLRVDAALLCFIPLIAIGGGLIDFGITLAIGTLAFWFIRIETLRWVVMSLEQDFSRYPIGIYTRGVRLVLAFVFPFAFMNYFPATFLLHKSETALSLSPEVGLLTPVVGLLWFGAAYAFWRSGLNHYQGTGS